MMYVTPPTCMTDRHVVWPCSVHDRERCGVAITFIHDRDVMWPSYTYMTDMVWPSLTYMRDRHEM